MGNKLPKSVWIGTIGEVLAQLRLLEFGIQSAPPIKDSGNDLIAIKGEIVKYIQVKTKLDGNSYSKNLPEIYHLLFCVDLKYGENDGGLMFDSSVITVFNKNGDNLGILNQQIVDELWSH